MNAAATDQTPVPARDFTLQLPVVEMFTCPGETHAISHAVHLARLAAYYPKCGKCVHNLKATASGSHEESVEAPQARRSLFEEEGIRGVYLNELNRQAAGELSEALASLLWDETPLVGRKSDLATSLTRGRRIGPTVVLGHDERPFSPDILAGVARSLRRMGCQVIDAGLGTRGCFHFAVRHYQALAGIYITGSGRPPSWTGLDVVGAGGIPWTMDDRLAELEARWSRGYERPLRQSAGQRVVHPGALHEASLTKHFHAFRPLKICVGCPRQTVRGVLERLFKNLACELMPVFVPVRARELSNREDADCVRMTAAVREHEAHLGVLIDDDEQSCAFFDEQGEPVPHLPLALLFAELLLPEVPRGVIVAPASSESLRPPVSAWGGTVLSCPENAHAVGRLMQESAAMLGLERGRFWFHEGSPVCDATLTLARLLQVLSRSDADFSALVRTAETLAR